MEFAELEAKLIDRAIDIFGQRCRARLYEITRHKDYGPDVPVVALHPDPAALLGTHPGDMSDGVVSWSAAADAQASLQIGSSGDANAGDSPGREDPPNRNKSGSPRLWTMHSAPQIR